MSLRSRITEDLRQAQADEDQLRITTLRLILTAIRDRDAARSAGDEHGRIPDDEIQRVLSRMVEMRRQSLSGYEEGGQFELVEREQAEIDVIAAYLPDSMDAEDTARAVDGVLKELGASSVRDMGRVMDLLRRRHNGRLDPALAGRLLRQRLAAGPGAGAAAGSGRDQT